MIAETHPGSVGPAYPVSHRYASWPARLIAAVIDCIFLCVVSVVAVAMMRFTHGALAPSPEDLAGNGGSLGYAEALRRTRGITVVLVPVTLLFIAAAGFWNLVFRPGRTGQSLGKQAVGLRLVDTGSAAPVGVGRAFVRQVAHVADALPFCLGYLWPLWDARRQTFADKLCGTVVQIAHGTGTATGVGTTGFPPPVVTPPDSNRGAEVSKHSGLLVTILTAGSVLTVVVVVGALLAGSPYDSSTGGAPGDAAGPSEPSGVARPAEVGIPRVSDIAVAPDGSRIYLAGSRSKSLTILKVPDLTVAATVSLPDEPWQLVVSPDGKQVYVATFSSVVVVDAATHRIVGTVPVRRPSVGDIAVTRDGTRVYVTAEDLRLAVIDPRSLSVITTIPIEENGTDYLTDLVLAPDGSRLYAGGPRGVSIIDTASNSYLGLIPQPSPADSVAVSPDGGTLLSMLGGDIEFYDLRGRAPLGDYHVYRFAADMAVAPTGRYAFLGGALKWRDTPPTSVDVIDIVTRSLVGSLGTGSGVRMLAVSPDAHWVYAVGDERLMVVDVSGYR
ncbi:RDD family protein [Nocardia gipuzkoensis]